MSEQEYIAARKQLQTSIQSFKASKQRVVLDFLQEHYPGLDFTIEIADSLDMDVLCPAEIEQSKTILLELNAYLAELNKQAEEQENAE